MPETMTLKIITPERIVMDRQVQSVTARGTDGEFEVLPGHQPMVATLGIDVLRYVVDGEEDHAAVMGGVLEVRENEVTILSDVAELDAEIDEARARQAKERAEAQKTQKAENIDVYASEVAIGRAVARLKAAEMRQRRKMRGGRV